MSSLQRQLGVVAVAAVVAGDMLGSGIFFTPGELAAVAQQSWQVYFFWALAGFITLCGAWTLAELSSLIPESGATFHIIRKGFGEFWAFLKSWVEMLISGPGSVAGVADAVGGFLSEFLDMRSTWASPLWGSLAIAFFTIINLFGVRWGGRTQIGLTAVKITALLALVFGSLWVTHPAQAAQIAATETDGGLVHLLRFVGLGVAVVLFTYDGWVDVTHAAGEVSNPKKNLPRGLIAGVTLIVLLYLFVNYAYLRAVPLERMRQEPTLVASNLAEAAFGERGSRLLKLLIMISIFGALGGLIMTLPRLFYGAAHRYQEHITAGNWPHHFFQGLSFVTKRTSV